MLDTSFRCWAAHFWVNWQSVDMLNLESIKCFIDLNISLHSEGVGCMAQGSILFSYLLLVNLKGWMTTDASRDHCPQVPFDHLYCSQSNMSMLLPDSKLRLGQIKSQEDLACDARMVCSAHTVLHHSSIWAYGHMVRGCVGAHTVHRYPRSGSGGQVRIDGIDGSQPSKLPMR